MVPTTSVVEEHTELVKRAAQIRELIYEDASDMMCGAMVGSPEECLFFAIEWIKKTKGLEYNKKVFTKKSIDESDKCEALKGWFVDYCPNCKAKFCLKLKDGEANYKTVTCPYCKYEYIKPKDGGWIG